MKHLFVMLSLAFMILEYGVRYFTMGGKIAKYSQGSG